MNKLFAPASVVLALLLVACGDNGVRSPDFDAVLKDIIVTGSPPTIAAGSNAQFRAVGEFTTPPATGGVLARSDITNDAAWSVVEPVSDPANPQNACDTSNTPSSKATVDGHGFVTGVSAGTVTIKASFKGKNGCAPLSIT